MENINHITTGDLVLASRGLRLGGALLDSLLALLVNAPILYFFGYWDAVFSGQPITLLQTFLYGVIGFTVFFVMHGYTLYTSGQTLGKKIVKTKIVTLDNKLPNFGSLVVLRYLVLGIVYFIPFIGSLMAFVNPLFIFGKEHRCLHDYMANTKVVKV